MAAAWNQRNAFQNHDSNGLYINPAAAIGAVAAITISDTARPSITTRCANPASHNTNPSSISTVAVVPVITPSVKSRPVGSHSARSAVPSNWIRSAVLSPSTAVTRAAP